MKTMTKLTEAQRKALASSVNSRPIEGLITFQDAGVGIGLRRAGWYRMMEGLERKGLVAVYVHGGYEITEQGRAALAAAT
jgi:hypothetical protein